MASRYSACGALCVGCSERRFQRRCRQRFQIARPISGLEYLLAMTSPCSVMRICAVHSARRLRQDGFIARSAAAPDRCRRGHGTAAAHVVPRNTSTRLDLGLVKLPARREIAAILVAVGIAEHHFLQIAAAATSRR